MMISQNPNYKKDQRKGDLKYLLETLVRFHQKFQSTGGRTIKHFVPQMCQHAEKAPESS